MISLAPAGSLTALSWSRRLRWAGLLITWSAITVVGLVLLAKGVQRTGYFEPTGEALERARVGDLLIFAGSVTTFAAACWAWWMRTPIWVCVLVATPAVLIGGFTLLYGGSVFLELSLLVILPVGLGGLISGLTLARPLRSRSGF